MFKVFWHFWAVKGIKISEFLKFFWFILIQHNNIGFYIKHSYNDFKISKLVSQYFVMRIRSSNVDKIWLKYEK